MLRLISQIAQFLSLASPVPSVAPVNGVAQQLLERAGARAVRDPHAALELRKAASAYLSVER